MRCSHLTFLILPAAQVWITKALKTTFTTAARPFSGQRKTLRLRVAAAASDNLLSRATEQSTRGGIHDSQPTSPLSCSMDELAVFLNGRGRAQAVWDCYRQGIDPILLYNDNNDSSSSNNNNNSEAPLSQERVQTLAGRLPTSTRHNSLGLNALKQLKQILGEGPLTETVAEVAAISSSADGTTKLLLQLKKDGMQIETVIIPWRDLGKSTLCVSSQVGCRQACTFCLTGRMGKLRSLTADEILVQVFLAKNICHDYGICPIDNIVFMGMGEPADNVEHVVRAALILVDKQQFAFAPRRVTISTVAPKPDSFRKLAQAPVALAWSVHSSRDEIRRQLVPTTHHSMVELRQGLIDTLLQRSRRQRSILVEVALLNRINDSVDDALHLADFCQVVIAQVPAVKLVVNLIPWNDIQAMFGPASLYQKPSQERILAFQRALIDRGILCYIRTTRGDDKNAACGQLATKKEKVEQQVRQPKP